MSSCLIRRSIPCERFMSLKIVQRHVGERVFPMSQSNLRYCQFCTRHSQRNWQPEEIK